MGVRRRRRHRWLRTRRSCAVRVCGGFNRFSAPSPFSPNDRVQSVASIRMNLLQNVRSWIVLPKQVEFSWSVDSTTWSPIVVRTHGVPVTRDAALKQPFVVSLPGGTRLRYVRVTGRNAGVRPAGHPRAGKPSRLFADKSVVRE